MSLPIRRKCRRLLLALISTTKWWLCSNIIIIPVCAFTANSPSQGRSLLRQHGPSETHHLHESSNDADHGDAASATIIYSNFRNVPCLRNDYYALRHGRSLANEAGVIASNPEVACTKYGLSPVGKEQAQAAGQTLVETFCQSQNKNYNGLLIVSSDLLRARETAQAVCRAAIEADIPVYQGEVVLQTWLRERDFGDWDGTSDANYQRVWDDDAMDDTHTNQNVESVVSVIQRVATGIMHWDAQLENYMVVCVAHGDVLQIGQTALAKSDGKLHRTLPHLETATLRYMPFGDVGS